MRYQPEQRDCADCLSTLTQQPDGTWVLSSEDVLYDCVDGHEHRPVPA